MGYIYEEFCDSYKSIFSEISKLVNKYLSLPKDKMLLIKRLKENLNELRVTSKNDCIIDLLRVVIGDMELQKSRSKNDTISEDECIKILKKLQSSNVETMSLSNSSELKEKLQKENDFLDQFLPSKMTITEVRQISSQYKEKLLSIPAGPAMGFLISQIKQTGQDFNISDVKQVLNEL